MPQLTRPIPVRSFAPDQDIITPGILIDGNDMYPTPRGLRTLPALHRVTESLTGPCLGSCVVTTPEGVQMVVAGTRDDLSVVLSQALSPTSPAAWGTQGLPPTPFGRPVRWRFAYYNNLVFAADGIRKPLYATLTALTLTPTVAWQDVPDSPPYASILASSDYSLFMIGDDLNAAGDVDEWSNRWWSSTNPFIWSSGSIANLSVNGRLSQTPGPIVAARALRSQMVLYKAQTIFIGQLVGPPLIWSFTEVSRQVGAVSQEAVVSVDDVHYFLGPDDWYRFDGFSVTKLENQHRNWFFERRAEAGAPWVVGRFDQARSLIFWHYKTREGAVGADQTADEWVCLDVRTGNWTKGNRVVQMATDGVSPGTVLSQDFGSTQGIFLNDDALYLYARTGQGASPGSFFTTGAIGDRQNMYQLSRVRPGYNILNGTPRMTPLNAYSPGAPFVAQTPVELSADGWFNCLNTARLQCLKFESDDDVAIADYQAQIAAVGDV